MQKPRGKLGEGNQHHLPVRTQRIYLLGKFRSAGLAKRRQVETEAAPIRYLAEFVGADSDSERAIRWLIALMVLCCDPLAIALTAAASAGR